MLVEIPIEAIPELVIVSFMSFTLLGGAFWALIELDIEIGRYRNGSM